MAHNFELSQCFCSCTFCLTIVDSLLFWRSRHISKELFYRNWIRMENRIVRQAKTTRRGSDIDNERSPHNRRWSHVTLLMSTHFFFEVQHSLKPSVSAASVVVIVCLNHVLACYTELLRHCQLLQSRAMLNPLYILCCLSRLAVYVCLNQDHCQILSHCLCIPALSCCFESCSWLHNPVGCILVLTKMSHRANEHTSEYSDLVSFSRWFTGTFRWQPDGFLTIHTPLHSLWHQYLMCCRVPNQCCFQRSILDMYHR